MLSGVWENVREWTSTLPSELPLWELESWWILESLENDYRGQNPLDWKIHYIIGKLLEFICLKWVCMTHLGTWNTNYGQNKGRESNCQIDYQPLKLWNLLDSFACKWSATYCLKAHEKGYNFTLDLTSIGGLHTKLWASKVVGVPILRILGLQLGNPETKWHLGADPVANHKKYYKGEGGDFP
jgi:hypothetical protein